MGRPIIWPNNLKVYGLARDRFVGRDAELARLHGLLQTQTQVAIAGVSSLGGVGKSDLGRCNMRGSTWTTIPAGWWGCGRRRPLS
jgi:hypothetical protein